MAEKFLNYCEDTKQKQTNKSPSKSGGSGNSERYLQGGSCRELESLMQSGVSCPMAPSTVHSRLAGNGVYFSLTAYYKERAAWAVDTLMGTWAGALGLRLSVVRSTALTAFPGTLTHSGSTDGKPSRTANARLVPHYSPLSSFQSKLFFACLF